MGTCESIERKGAARHEKPVVETQSSDAEEDMDEENVTPKRLVSVDMMWNAHYPAAIPVFAKTPEADANQVFLLLCCKQ